MPAEADVVNKLKDLGALRFVAEYDHGLIKYNADRVHPVDLFAQIARAWPRWNVTLVTGNREAVIGIAKSLRVAGLDVFGFTARNQPCVEKRVAVATYAGMANNPASPDKQNIVVVLDVAEATSKQARWCRQHLERARLYGLLATQRHLSPYEADLVRSLFGFRATLVPQHGRVLRPVEVLWVPGQGRPPQHEPESILQLKRHGVWNNEARNRQVARIAREFVSGALEQVQKLLPSAAACRQPMRPSGMLVMVDNVEHAVKLMPKLPGWPVVLSGLANLDGLPAEQRAELDRRRQGEFVPHGCGIVTEAGLGHSTLLWPLVGVVIRADAGTGLPAIPNDALLVPACETAPAPLLVVDLDDRHHPELRRRAQQRRRAYLELGWLPPGQDAARYRIVQFLRSRLKGGTQ
jgi:hypothetical protein